MSKKKRVIEGLSFKLPLALKTGKYEIGYKQALRLLRNNLTKCLIIAGNFSPLCRKRLEYYSVLLGGIPITVFKGSNNDLAKMCDQSYRINVISILDQGEADLIGVPLE